ncbi:alpha-2Db adrenergic receptor-like, partial [Strongylocentrotus purpuratus]|uniref:G-protein coupled receptors family 1 profile domain-containing protein n=1 Tax=Strongylocentrotus purpuratus TaxID=7668 RepID=A0A7M7G167_STRPU
MAIYYTLLNTTTFQLNTFTGRTAVYLGIGIPCIIVLLAGNVMVIAAVFTQRALKKPSYYLLTSLAITDVITGTIAIPLELYRRVVTNDITCSAKWDVYFTSVVYMCASDSMFHMVIITFDRYLAVLKPLRYNALMTPQRILMLALLGWLTSTLIAIEQILVMTSLITVILLFSYIMTT